MNRSTHFYRAVHNAGTMIVKNVEREQAIRVYCERYRESWILQVRGPQRTGAGFQEGKAFMVATAHLNLEDLIALRDACSALIEEQR